MTDISTIGWSLGGSIAVAFTILKTLVRSEARDEMKDDISKIHTRIDTTENSFVSCKSCTIQHTGLNTTLDNINRMVTGIYEWILKKDK